MELAHRAWINGRFPKRQSQRLRREFPGPHKPAISQSECCGVPASSPQAPFQVGSTRSRQHRAPRDVAGNATRSPDVPCVIGAFAAVLTQAIVHGVSRRSLRFVPLTGAVRCDAEFTQHQLSSLTRDSNLVTDCCPIVEVFESRSYWNENIRVLTHRVPFEHCAL
jgi:hypothetical protein